MFKAKFQRKRGKVNIPNKIQGFSKVKVGWPKSQVPGAVIDKAIWNHFGTETIPERPALSNAMRSNRSGYKQSMRNAASKVLRGKISLNSVTARLGILAQGDVQAEIVNLRTPPNAQSTIDQKGSSNPLIDSGEMKNSVTFESYD